MLKSFKDEILDSMFLDNEVWYAVGNSGVIVYDYFYSTC